jgi:hypothetical protein
MLIDRSSKKETIGLRRGHAVRKWATRKSAVEDYA